jgi:hypothetical protein
MRRNIVGTAMAILVLAACRKDGVAPPTPQGAIDAWQGGHKSAALEAYLNADWDAQPLFPAGSVLNISEDQLVSLPGDQGKTNLAILDTELKIIKEVSRAALESEKAAVHNGDIPQARRCLTAVKRCGTALSSSGRIMLVQFVGQALTNAAEAQLRQLPK